MPRYILLPSTSPGFSEEVVLGNVRESLHIFSEPLGAGELIQIQIKQPSGSFSDYSINGELQTIVEGLTGIWVLAPGIYRASKGATASPVGISLSTPQEP